MFARCRRWLFGLALLAGAWRVSAAAPTAEELEALYGQCLAKHGLACNAYAAPGGARLREAPSATARTLMSVPHGGLVLLHALEEPADAPGWLPARAIVGEGRGVPAWVRRKDLVSLPDFHRVVGCWPVKSMRWLGPLGDEGLEHMPYRLDFDADGSIRWPEQDGGMMIDRGSVVWYAQGLFRLAPPGAPSEAFTTTFVLRRGAGGAAVSATTDGDPALQLRATVRKLAGCSQGPKVDPGGSLAGP